MSLRKTNDVDEDEAKAELKAAQKRLDKLTRKAEPVEAESRALNHVLSEPAEEMTLAQLRALEQRRNYLQQILEEQWQEIGDAYKAVAAAKEKVKEQRSGAGQVCLIA